MKENFLKFPQNFLWGTTTSSYQVEGGIKNNDWEYTESEKAKRACDHYHLYEADFDILKRLNQNAYRFSIEWARIEPEENKFNFDELKHYRLVISALKRRNIVPFLTLFHFTAPIWFYRKDGWLNKKSPDYFANYVEFVIKNLQVDVKFWLTINEPLIYTLWYPPLKTLLSKSRGFNLLKQIKVLKNLLLAHKKAYKILHHYGLKDIQVGIAKNNVYFDSAPGIFSFFNKFLANLAKRFWNKLFIDLAKEYLDFIGLNYYFHREVKISFSKPLSWFRQNRNSLFSDMNWEICPKGIYYVLKELKKYNLPIYITENGIADEKDKLRKKFILEHLFWIHKAIKEGIDVRGYFYWSLLDNFEWEKGFKAKFGLLKIEERTLKRSLKKSAFFYQDICRNNGFTYA